MALQSERSIDSIDWKILRELQQDARLSYNELGRRVGLSAPATAERVRKLEDAGVITGYSAQVDPEKVGMPLLALIHLRCNQGLWCLLRTSVAQEFPEVLELHKLSGSHCVVLKVALSSMQHLEAFTDRLSVHGTLVTHLVTSSVLIHRLIDWEHLEADFALPSHSSLSQIGGFHPGRDLPLRSLPCVLERGLNNRPRLLKKPHVKIHHSVDASLFRWELLRDRT
jgi:Lrp/AsnC family transcriptional regulator, leucine-responsive regulatory protein